ncbi:MAG: dual specificity protein phosphatase family protein [Verrucomicrobia bacterium]|nr:dual specificity protein phosphatase family protein [Verrucomicrobiota bacterium]MBS0636337.1 dual specificity protein phosphatase family protein [Verrucomicrobiota bacterium]
MQGIGRFGTSECFLQPPQQQAVATVRAEAPSMRVLEHQLDAFCFDLTARRTQKKAEVAALFTNDEHVESICGSLSQANREFVSNIVHNPHFLGSLCQRDVAFILKSQPANVAILYIEEQWIPRDLSDSCSPKDLDAKLKISFKDSSESITEIILQPGTNINSVSQTFLKPDPLIQTNRFFQGFSQCNLLFMSAAASAKDIFDACESITQEEVNAFLQDGFRAHVTTDRYSDVRPYKKNCVNSCQDINGSYVKAGNRLFIACQGPAEATVDAFWQTAIHHRTPLVIAIGPSRERHTEKFFEGCFSFNDCLTLTDGTKIVKSAPDRAIDWELATKTGEDPIRHSIIIRTFTVGAQQIRHLHCPTWRDMKGIDPKILTELIQLIGETPKDDGAIMVHCSAGIGRTGTLLAAVDIHHQHNSNPQKPLSLAATIMELRHQRYGLVQTVEQVHMLLGYFNSL